MDCATVGSGAAGGDGGVMEGSLTTSSGGGTGGGARWNPTKEQINILESLYSQGIRTPSAEQIQQITGRLKVYGNIEGKNVFYWFQNHKARQRQKQKQEQKVAYYSKMLHYQQQPPQHRQGFTPILPAPPPPTSTLTTNARSATHPQFAPALYNPYLPQSKLCYYPQYQPGCISIKSGPMQMPVLYPHHHDRLPAASAPINYNCSGENGFANPAAMNHDNNVTTTGGDGKEDKTLNLFPVHPTGILQEERKLSSSSSSSTSGGASNSSSSGGDDRAAVGCFGSGTGRFIDFFSGHESTERG